MWILYRSNSNFIYQHILPHSLSFLCLSTPDHLFYVYPVLLYSIPRSPRIYAGCFGCQIVAYALGGVVSYNPDKRFVLKAETINVVHNFSEHLLSAHPPTAAIRDSTEQAEGVEEGEESSLSTEKIHGCCSYNAQDPCAVMRASVSRAAYNSCPCPCNALTDSDLGGDTIGSNSVYDIQGADDCVDLAAVSHALPIALAVESVRSETETACVSRQESEDCTDGEGEGCTGGAAHTGSKRSTAIKALKIIVSHGDCVETLPPDSTLLGSSSSCTNEMYVSGSYRNIFSCQSHPEFEYDYCIKERIWPSVVTLNKRLNEEEIKTAVESFESHTRDDSEVLLGVIKSFLKLPCTSCVCCQPSCSREEKD